MSSRNHNKLMGFPLKVFVKSEPFKAEIKKTQVKSSSDNRARQFYEDLPAASSSNSAQPPSVPVVAVPPKKARHYSLNQLFQAVSTNDTRLVSDALTTRRGREVLTRRKDPFGWSALMVASYGGHDRMAGLLLQAGADPAVADKAGNTCLSLAAKAGHTKVTDIILAGGNHKRTPRKPSAQNTASTPGHCNTCGEDVSCIRTHTASTTHRLKAEMADGGPKTRAYYGIGRTNRGFQMMVRNDGWDPDTGLGREGDGKLYPVKTTLKRDRKGLGAEGAPGPRVTHFGPFDQRSVETKDKAKRLERSGTQDRKSRKKTEAKQTRNEIDFRREFL